MVWRGISPVQGKLMKIFISSVQKEFAAERRALAKMIREDRWLGGFFDVFLFEECTAKAKTPQ